MINLTNIRSSFPSQVDYKEENPFSKAKFYKNLEESECVSSKAGWTPNHFINGSGLLPGYIKDHSYGEYIFDWAWAQLYEQIGVNYYPKLVHMVPFSPINSEKFLNVSEAEKKELTTDSFKWYQTQELSGQHYLFTGDDEFNLKDLGFAHYKTIQYHFKNKYESFEEFLSSLKKNRRKMISKERRKLHDSDLTITSIDNQNITAELLSQFYHFYISTISKKGSYPYLTKQFFLNLISLNNQNLMLTIARQDENIIAMALFLKSSDVLYGRYWGILPEYENLYPGLHFELCYYQGIEYCIKNKIPLFEAGAQGEHKLWRGFEPAQINSYHHLKIPELFDIIKKDINRQNGINDHYLLKLKQYLPFKFIDN